MRTLILTLLVGVVGLSSCSISTGKSFDDYEMTQKHFNLQEDFSSIRVSQGIEVEVTPGNKNEADAESEAMEYLRLDVEDNALIIRYDNSIGNYMRSPKTKIRLTAKNIEDFNASSSGSIKVNGQFSTNQASLSVSSSGDIVYDFKGSALDVSASSSGNIEGNIEVSELNIGASSSADIELKGKANVAIIDASSSAGVDLGNLKMKEAEVRASSAADVKLSISESLEAQASSGAEISYKALGNKRVNTNVSASSGGSIARVSSF